MGRVLFEPTNPNKVRHIVDGRLKRGVQYRVYVTQVNNKNMESPRSAPSYIMAGDTTPPPAPELTIDTSLYPNGCHAEGAKCDVFLRWYIKPTPDVVRFEVFRWNDRPQWYKQDGEYPAEFATTADTEIFVGSADYSTLIGGCFSNREIYVGIRAVDLSHNTSPLRVIRVPVVDMSEVDKPESPLHAEPYGVWAIKVWMDCPKGLENIKAVEIYRDGETRIAALLFDEGHRIQCIDPADYDIGIEHYYTYRFITEDGRTSPMSIPSKTVMANVIDTSYIDEKELEAFNEAWSNGGLKGVKELRDRMEKTAKERDELSERLKNATEDYAGLINEYQRLVNDFEQMSERLEDNEKTISALRSTIQQTSDMVALKVSKEDMDKATQKLSSTAESQLSITKNGISSSVSKLAKLSKKVNSFDKTLDDTEEALNSKIEQNATDITLRATKGEIDTATEQVRQDIVSQLKITEDSITSVVNRGNEIKSSITQMRDAINLCVKTDNLKSQIVTTVQSGISVGVIKADRVVVNGECLLQGNARCVGKWTSNTFSIVDPRTGKPIWGSDTGTVKPQVVTFEHCYGSGYPRMLWVGGTKGKLNQQSLGMGDWAELDWVQFTPQPPVKFNGVTTVKISISGTFHVSQPTPAVKPGAIPPNFNNAPMLGFWLVDGNVSGDQNNYRGADVFSQNSPIAAAYVGGVGKIVGTGANVSCTGGKGWENHYYSKQWYTYKTGFGISCTKSLYIGRKTQLHLLVKVLRRDRYNTNNVGLQNVRWRIECS